MNIVTAESVGAACEALVREGRRPSVRLVIEQLGGGSPNSVLPHLKAWKAARPSVVAAEIVIDPQIARLIQAQVLTASDVAAQAARDRAAEAEADAEEVAKAGREAEALASRLLAELEEAKGRLLVQDGQLQERTAELQQLREDAADQVRQAQEQARQATADADARADGERKRADALTSDLALSKARAEQVPGLEQRIEQLAAKLEQLQRTEQDAQRAAAVATARYEDQVKAGERIEQELRAQVAAAAQREADARRREDVLLPQLNALQAELVELRPPAGKKGDKP